MADKVNDPDRVVVSQMSNQSQAKSRECLFKRNGCLQTFASLEESYNHAPNCFHGIFQICTSTSCLANPSVIQPNPKALLNHAVTQHGCILSQPNIAKSMNMVLPRKYFFPTRVVMRFLRKFTLRVETSEMEIVMVMIIMPNEGDAEVLIAAVQIEPKWDQTSSSAHLIELTVCVDGKNRNRISRLPSDVSGESAQQLMMASTVNGFRSPQEFFKNFRSVKAACFSRNAIVEQGRASEQSVSLTITTKLTVYGCSVMGSVSSNLHPYASCWKDLGLSDPQQEAIHGKYAESPGTVAKIVIPQMKVKKDVMIESGSEETAMEALTLGILLNVTPSAPSSPQPQPSLHCNVLALFPTNRSAEIASNQWTEMVTASNLTCAASLQKKQIMVHSSVYSSSWIGHSQVIFTSMASLASIMTTDDDARLWTLLTDKMQFLHLHAPGRLVAKGKDLLKAFTNKLGVEKMNKIIKTAYDLDLTSSKELCEELRSLFFQNQPLILKLGNDPTPLIHEYITTSTCIHVADTKTQTLCRFLNRYARNNKRWLIFSEPENLEPVGMALKSGFPIEKINIFSSEDTITNCPDFFKSFLHSNDGILLAPLWALDYVELYKVDRIILYNYPKLKSDILRICMAVKEPFTWSTKPIIFWLQ